MLSFVYPLVQDPLKENYGEMKNDSQGRFGRNLLERILLNVTLGSEYMRIDTFTDKRAGDHVRFRCRIHHIRAISEVTLDPLAESYH